MSSERNGKIYRLAVPVLKSTQHLVISCRSCEGTAKKCTKKRDARAEMFFFLLKTTVFQTFPLNQTSTFLSSHYYTTNLEDTLSVWVHNYANMCKGYE